MRRSLGVILSFAVLVGMFCVGSAAAAWPEKHVKLIVVYGAGGGTDITARLLAQGLEKVTGKQFVVENITGGAGWVGWSALAKAKPDGYTIGYLNIPHLYAGYLDPKMKRTENLESFTPIMNHVDDPCIWAVKYDSPHKSLKELVEAIKKEPGKFSIANHGYGGDDNLAVLDMERMAGLKFNVVHNNSTTISRAQLLGGHVDLLGANVSEVFQNHQNKELRVLGVMSSKRSPFLPDVPTFKELGWDAQWASTRGVGAPAGLPQEIVKPLTEALVKVINSPEHQEKAKQLGLALDVIPSAEYMELMKKTEQRIKTLMGW
ncbi:MAG: tripartite tricarboxylate transporter substrate binding protein [Proteobacteria bacterium]|nr:tripartite tricarboxylate transporter substrate binding protein [Pseudomonadota bacterium]MBU2228089.1 tripartite tricarboxylate transporter substrate binding protein [Pseudomonadota bacterium]MBU2261412.1 tripartite tricarboxylate transporter substrate binding protein [Pseudomonadota bacterium]